MINADLTTGPLGGHFKRLAVPAAVGMLFSTLYNVVDTFYAGYFGTQAQAGLSVGFQAFFILVAIGFGLSSAMSALVGNAKGRKDEAESRHLAVQGIGLAVMAVGAMLTIALFAGPYLIAIVSEPGDYRDAGLDYFYWLIFALPGFIVGPAANGILQARGDTRTMQRALVVAFFVNVGLNPLLMFGIPGVVGGMGFNGIALATVLSQTGVAGFILWRVFGRAMMQDLRWAEFIPVPAKYYEIIAQAFPAGFALLVTFSSGFIVQYALKDYGEAALASYGITMRIEQLFLLPALGITISLVPIAAQNFGAGQNARVREAFHRCWILGVIGTTLAFPFLWFGGGLATSVFSDDPEVIRISALFLKVEAVILPIYVVLFSINSLLQALKKAAWTMWIGIYRQWIGIALFIWFFAYVMDGGLTGVRLGIAAGVGTGLLLSLWIGLRVAEDRIGGLGSPWIRAKA
ncbi:MATE family efflux transporter [Sulfitobacter guttiformis]|uniref:Putative MATE family efflux protein n=1 Tax=Sulfitobacter guttiformis TaxID=74349 RepID=A0A420DU39_9RHOB|nr:MATE family efflux transporter [Sulfitobacter guttiformis]KIN71220.1 MATE efflux family protein [Sulfitobacter guttiformis KCTC 32187]RKE97690.1 putative MATE family efflux protein [Sulfitobacter guttiformis]